LPFDIDSIRNPAKSIIYPSERTPGVFGCAEKKFSTEAVDELEIKRRDIL
jgi:hypothetical protein